MILLITGWFDETDRHGHRTGKKLFLTSHGIDLDNDDRIVITSCDPPSTIKGARFDDNYQEWVID
jgi:hypothetical protein